MVHVREVAVGDAAAVVRLAAELGYALDESATRERIARPAPGFVTLVAQADDGAVVGMISATERTSLVAGHRVDIESLVVTDARRSGGIGAVLLAAAEAWARERNAPRVCLHSNVLRERAHGFYLAHAYTHVKAQYFFEKRL